MKNKIENPKVFISYAWGTDEYQAKVLSFATALVDDGIDVILAREIIISFIPRHIIQIWTIAKIDEMIKTIIQERQPIGLKHCQKKYALKTISY